LRHLRHPATAVFAIGSCLHNSTANFASLEVVVPALWRLLRCAKKLLIEAKVARVGYDI